MVSGPALGSSPGSCPGCGDRIAPRALAVHVCDWWRWLDHQVALRRDELDRFEHELGSYLDSSRGRFELWYAERERGYGGAALDDVS
jgi:hypothetical protein